MPEQLVSDNGAQFTSEEFERFLKSNGIKHIRSAPYHPAINGEAERFVQTFKHVLKTSASDDGSLETKLARFLLTYRSTPNSTTNVSPSELLFHRRILTRLDILSPNLFSNVTDKQTRQKYYHDRKSKQREFEIDQTVLVENPGKDPKWLTGIILERLGPITYKVKVGEYIWKRHIDQMLRSEVETQDRNDNLDIEAFEAMSSTFTDSPQTRAPVINERYSGSRHPPEPRYSQRTRHPPIRLDPSFQ